MKELSLNLISSIFYNKDNGIIAVLQSIKHNGK